MHLRYTLSRIRTSRLPRKAGLKSPQEPGKYCPDIVAIYMKVIQTISFFFSFLFLRSLSTVPCTYTIVTTPMGPSSP